MRPPGTAATLASNFRWMIESYLIFNMFIAMIFLMTLIGLYDDHEQLGDGQLPRVPGVREPACRRLRQVQMRQDSQHGDEPHQHVQDSQV